eukprot:6401683-Pyramimonas_sp.AAC.1
MDVSAGAVRGAVRLDRSCASLSLSAPVALIVARWPCEFRALMSCFSMGDFQYDIEALLASLEDD